MAKTQEEFLADMEKLRVAIQHAAAQCAFDAGIKVVSISVMFHPMAIVEESGVAIVQGIAVTAEELTAEQLAARIRRGGNGGN